MVKRASFKAEPWRGSPVLAVILGDFGRAATVRFAAGLSEEERKHLVEHLPDGKPFYDEYRKVAVAMHGDLRFVKENLIATYLERGQPFDERILVGFPGGPTVSQVECRLGIMALEAMSGPVLRGVEDILVLIPCNTLAPVSWSLANWFSTRESLLEMIERGGGAERTDLKQLVPLLIEECKIIFPTVPEAVAHLAHRDGVATLVLLGTTRIDEIYAEAFSRSGRDMALVPLAGRNRQSVLTAITNAIDASPAAWKRSKLDLEELARSLEDGAGGKVAVVSACTDLDYGVGIDSEKAYAKYAVELAYATDP